MGRASSVDELPEEIKGEIGRLRIQGATIDQILDHLRALHVGVSRSALGRHVKSIAVVADRMRRSQDVATALVRELGDAPESQTARLNIALLHSTILDLFMGGGDGDGAIDENGKAALAGNPEGVMLLAKAIDHLTKSTRTDADFRLKLEAAAAARAKAAAAVAVETEAKARGLSAETVAAIKGSIFGVAA